ncbi:hypothetical protein [Methylobacterium indicum]|uniref:hypothetical protein n=1 Tax=Methylobacterium indicum TaxID=1775910 RepID=UPI002435FCE3|nr:hypothetical protein [Methylobacterium indicum]
MSAKKPKLPTFKCRERLINGILVSTTRVPDKFVGLVKEENKATFDAGGVLAEISYMYTGGVMLHIVRDANYFPDYTSPPSNKKGPSRDKKTAPTLSASPASTKGPTKGKGDRISIGSDKGSILSGQKPPLDHFTIILDSVPKSRELWLVIRSRNDSEGTDHEFAMAQSLDDVPRAVLHASGVRDDKERAMHFEQLAAQNLDPKAKDYLTKLNAWARKIAGDDYRILHGDHVDEDTWSLTPSSGP